MRKGKRTSIMRRLPCRIHIAPTLVAGVLLLGLLLGCGGSSESRMTADHAVSEPVSVEREELAVEEAAAPLEPAAGAGDTVERLIIRTGNISMIVEDTRQTRAAIERMVAEMAGDGAFVVSGDEYGATEGAQPYISLSIRVPATRFEDVMGRLAELAVEVVNRSESAQDVTEEYVDLEARLESLEAARQRLLEIMEDARTTKDLLEAEQQLTQREAEIESIKGRMQYLEQSARLSSIWIELQPHILSQPVGDQWRPAETVRRAFDSLLNGLRAFGDFLIFFAIALLPWLLLLLLVIYIIFRIVQRRSRGRRKEETSADQESTQGQ
jgi:hypothetical protein